MPIDSSGNVTGTGNTLADAVGVVAGISSQVIGGLTIYSLDLAGNPYINIQNGGFLAIDPRTERTIIVSYPTLTSTTGIITVMSGGTFTGGFDVSSAGTDKYTQGEIITSGVAVGSGSAVCCGIWHLLFGQTGSNIILLGVTIASSTYWKSLGNIQFRDVKHLGIDSTAQIRLGGGSVDIDGFEVHGFSLVLNVNLTGSDVFNGFKPVLSALSLSVESTDINTPQVNKPVGVFGNIDNSFNAFRSPVSLWQKTAGYVLHNMTQGGLTAEAPQNTATTSYGFIEQYKDFELTIKDDLGNLIDGAKVYVPQYTFSEAISASDNTFHGRNWAEKPYSDTAVNGVANINSFLYKIQHTQRSATTYYVYADKVGSGVGVIDFKVKSYGKLITIVTDVTCEGIDAKLINITCFDDILITETSKSIVEAYPITVTLIGNTITVTGDASTLQSINSYQLYDAVDLLLSNNYTGESETIINRVSDSIDAKALDVVFDYITFDGSLITTGAVALNNGSTASGNVFDNTQDSSFSEIGGSLFKAYLTESDRDNRINAIVSNVPSYSFLFSAVPANPLWLWIDNGNTELPAKITLLQGINTIDLGTGALLTALPITIDEAISNQLDGIDLPGIVATSTRQELTPDLERISQIKTKVDALENADFTPVITAINALNDLSISEIDLSSVLAKEATLITISTAIAAIPTTGLDINSLPTVAQLALVNENVKDAGLGFPGSRDIN
jgi:hypothetical protein